MLHGSELHLDHLHRETTMPLLSPTFQVDLRNFCGDGWKGLPLQQTRDMFDAAGVKPSSPENLPPSGQRRALTNHYLNVIDWESEEDITKVLKAVSIALFSKKTSAEHKAALRELCEKEGLRIGADKVTLPGRAGPRGQEPHLRLDRLQA